MDDRGWVNGWLVEYHNEHTCAGGTAETGYAHEPSCGMEPLRRQLPITVRKLGPEFWMQWEVQLSTEDKPLAMLDPYLLRVIDARYFDNWHAAIQQATEWQLWLTCPGHERAPFGEVCMGCGYDFRWEHYLG